MTKKSIGRISLHREMICNICGNSVLVYSVMDNAILCEDCVPVKKMKKQLPNETNMINTILNQKLEEKEDEKQRRL